MPDFRSDDAYQVIWLLRRLFRALADHSGALLADLGVTAADRAVLEFLYPDKELTVPDIATKYCVSRQHVQVTVNGLLERGLVDTRDNPRHKRSPLVALGGRGRQLFKRILDRDQKVVADLFAKVPTDDVTITRQTLQTLLDHLPGAQS